MRPWGWARYAQSQQLANTGHDEVRFTEGAFAQTAFRAGLVGLQSATASSLRITLGEPTEADLVEGHLEQVLGTALSMEVTGESAQATDETASAPRRRVAGRAFNARGDSNFNSIIHCNAFY